MQNYFWYPNICRIAKFGDDILNRSRTITIEVFFSSAVLALNFDVDLLKVNSGICHR